MSLPSNQNDNVQHVPIAADLTAPVETPTLVKPEQPSAKPASKTGGKLKVIALAAAMGGIIFGGMVEYFVQGAMDATGWFGVTLDNVVEQQKTNFEDIRAKLDALGKAKPGSPEAIKLQGELSRLVNEQEQLTGRTHTEIAQFHEEITRLKSEMLAQKGSTSGADFWLKPNESVTVRDRGNVFSLITVHYNGGQVTVNFSGQSHRLKPGDFVEFKSGDETCKVFYKVGKLREDGRVGFDLVCNKS